MLLIEMLLGIRQFLKTQTCYIALGDLPRIGYIGLHWISEAINPLSANPTKWPNTLKQFVGKLPTNCLSVFGHFVNLALKRLKSEKTKCSWILDFRYVEEFVVKYF